MATSIPAHLVKLDGNIGSLREGLVRGPADSSEAPWRERL